MEALIELEFGEPVEVLDRGTTRPLLFRLEEPSGRTDLWAVKLPSLKRPEAAAAEIAAHRLLGPFGLWGLEIGLVALPARQHASIFDDSTEERQALRKAMRDSELLLSPEVATPKQLQPAPVAGFLFLSPPLLRTRPKKTNRFRLRPAASLFDLHALGFGATIEFGGHFNLTGATKVTGAVTVFAFHEAGDLVSWQEGDSIHALLLELLRRRDLCPAHAHRGSFGSADDPNHESGLQNGGTGASARSEAPPHKNHKASGSPPELL